MRYWVHLIVFRHQMLPFTTRENGQFITRIYCECRRTF